METVRFIPAGAGNSPENIHDGGGYGGLSPLARGTPTFDEMRDGGRRFIPAGAGNSGPPCSHLPNFPVYPRWRGELNIVVDKCRCYCGLSPLARGTLLRPRCLARLVRFIPAGAGNSTVQTAGYYFFAVYPRWRGELSKSIHLFLKHFFP